MRCYSVPRCRFNIRDHDDFDDEDGMILPDDGTAREHAIQIMDELQKADAAGWVDHIMKVSREGSVWRIPFSRPSLPT